MKHGNLLTSLIILALVLGCLVGQIFLFDKDNPITNEHWSYQIGNLVLIRPLMLMIIPLIFVSVVCGVTSIGDPSRLGVVGGSTIAYYIATMLIAVTIGAVLVTTIKPGELDEGIATKLRANAESQYENSPVRDRIESAQEEQKDTLGGVWRNILEQLIPKNLVREVLEVRPLGVIVAALLFGLALAIGHQRCGPVIELFNALFEAIMILVRWIIWLTPVGVFFLVAWTVGSIGFTNIFGPLVMYIGTVIIGLIIHGIIVLPLIMYLFTKRNPFRFMWQMRKALMTAFGTDSSSATLPVTIETAENEGGCSKRASNFVLPLGSTINMDGTALYEAVAVIFLFQLYGIDLSFTEFLVVVITATLAAIGAAGIPSAGVVTMVVVIVAVNTSLGSEMLPFTAIGVIISVDRIVDMCRTTVNVWGDSVGAKIITQIAPDDPPTPPESSAPAAA